MKNEITPSPIEYGIFPKITLLNPTEVYGIFIPLGENSIVQLVGVFQEREDVEVIETDLYYNVTIEYKGFKITFYSRGLVILEKGGKSELLTELIEDVQRTSLEIPAIVRHLLTLYHLSLVEVFDNFESIPVYNTILTEKISGENQDITKQSDFLQLLSENNLVQNFIGDIRSISNQDQIQLIIGIDGSIVQHSQDKLVLVNHFYIRSLHLFLTKYNLVIENVWNTLNEYGVLIDDFETYLLSDDFDAKNNGRAFFTEGVKSSFYETKTRIIHGLKYGDKFIVLTKFIDDSITFTLEKYVKEELGSEIIENLFHINKTLQVLTHRTNHLKILSESFQARSKNLYSKIALFDSEMTNEKLVPTEILWQRTLQHQLTPATTTVKAKETKVTNPQVLISIYLPLGENAILHLVDDFQKREDFKLLHTDLYYHVEVECDCHKNIFTFYARGLVTISINLEDSDLSSIIEETDTFAIDITSHLQRMIPKYYRSLIEVIGDIQLIPVHTTLIIDKFENLSDDQDRSEFLNALVENWIIKNFVGITRSIDSRPHEDVIIGTNGSIIRNDEAHTYLSYHCYNRSLHLFLVYFNLLIEDAWNNLNDCAKMVDDFEDYMTKDREVYNIETNDLFSSEQKVKLSKSRFQVIKEIKNIDHFLVISNFVENSIEFTLNNYKELLESGEIPRNSFEIPKIMKMLKDRGVDLKIIVGSFTSRAQTLVTRLELYDAEITYESQQRAERIKMLENSWRRTFTHELEPAKTKVNSKDVLVVRPRIVFSLFLPLGENGIVRLVDLFSHVVQQVHGISIVDTDLYYHVTIKSGDYEITFLSRGLVLITRSSDDEPLADLMQKASTIVKEIPTVLTQLIPPYNLSLVRLLGPVEDLPIHKTIIIDSFSKKSMPDFRLEQVKSEEERDEYLRALSEDERVLSFIGQPRSVDSRDHEDVIIGTDGSLIRSEDVDTLLPFHAYNRSLHLFLEKYNLQNEKVWETIRKGDDLVNVLERFMNEKIDKEELDRFGLHHSDRRKNLRTTRLFVVKGLKHVKNFNVLAKFIEESIQFTIDEFSTILQDVGLKANSFHIQKLLNTLRDRAKHLKIVSEGFTSVSNSLFSRIDINDSEVAAEQTWKLQKIAWTFSIAAVIFSIVAFVQRTFVFR